MCLRKNEKSKGKEDEWRTERAELKFCAHQYLYISEYLG